MATKMSWAAFCMAAARAILQLREARRKLILYVIVALLAVFALGTWPLAGWLESHPLRFIFYWSGCAFLAIFLFLLGLYDFLSVMKEYKDQKKEL